MPTRRASVPAVTLMSDETGCIRIDGNFIMKVAPHFTGDRRRRPRPRSSARSGRKGRDARPLFDQYQAPDRAFHGQVTHECAGFRNNRRIRLGGRPRGATIWQFLSPAMASFQGARADPADRRANHRRMGQHPNMDLEGNPTLAAEPRTSLIIAREYWQDRTINDPADQDDPVR